MDTVTLRLDMYLPRPSRTTTQASNRSGNDSVAMLQEFTEISIIKPRFRIDVKIFKSKLST